MKPILTFFVSAGLTLGLMKVGLTSGIAMVVAIPVTILINVCVYAYTKSQEVNSK